MNILKKIKTFILTPNYSFRNVLFALILGFGIAYATLLAMYGTADANFLVQHLFKQDFLDMHTSTLLIRKITILAMAGLAVAFGMKAGILNIGVSGQMTAGGIVGYIIIQYSGWMRLEKNNNWVLAIMFFVVVGTSMVVALLTGILKSYLKVNEVISTIMINWIIVYIAKRFTTNESKDAIEMGKGAKGFDTTRFVHGNDWLITGICIGVSILFIIIAWFYLSQTKFGFKIIATGMNKDAAHYAGYNSKLLTLNAFVISGALAGVAGYLFFFLSDNSIPAFEVPLAEGFTGIAVALVAMLNPWLIIPSSILFGLLEGPIGSIDAAGFPPSVIQVFSGVITYFVAISSIFLYLRPFLFIKDSWARYALNHKGGAK